MKLFIAYRCQNKQGAVIYANAIQRSLLEFFREVEQYTNETYAVLGVFPIDDIEADELEGLL